METMQKSESLLTKNSPVEQRAHLIELLPTPEQDAYFQKACGTSRFVYNWALATWNRLYQAGEKPNAARLKKQFNSIKYQQFPWLKEIHRDAHAQPFTNLQKAWSNRFSWLKTRVGPERGEPKFKKKGKCRDSFYVANDKLTVSGYQIHLPLVGWVRMTETLRYGGRVLSATVSKRNDRWFVSLPCEFEVCWLIPRNRRPKIGVDVGIKTFATLSSGEKIVAPRPFKSALRRLRILSRKRDKRNKSAKAKAELNRKLAQIHFRVSNIRKDFLHKLTHRLCRENQAIAYEDLHLQFMLSNRKLARQVQDLGLGEFFRQLEYKGPDWETTLHQAKRNYPSSQLCSCCGYRFRELTLQIRFWTCPVCQTHHDRDENASINLENVIPVPCGYTGSQADQRRPALVEAVGVGTELCAHKHTQER